MAFAGTYIRHIKTTILAATRQLPLGSPKYDKTVNDSTTSKTHTEFNHPGVLDTELTALTKAERNIFIAMLTILFALSLCGNMCSLFVNFRRKIRPFFRACLISLAFSDLINTVFLTTAYLAQFTAEYVQIWRLGNLMCSLIPFATTSAILASSMILVGIAVDRYYAVMKAGDSFWNPNVISSIVCLLCMWLASVVIACPVFTFYDTMPVYILTEAHETTNATALTKPLKPNISVTTHTTAATSAAVQTKTAWEIIAGLGDFGYSSVRQYKVVNMCVSDENIKIYYTIVFVIIFIPCIGAFFWFNSIIARKLWQRKHTAAITKKNALERKNKAKPKSSSTPIPLVTSKHYKRKTYQTSSSTVASSLTNTLPGKASTPAAVASSSASSTVKSTSNSCRETRHLRMFIIILLMMAVFLFLHLPAWIFLLMRLFGNYTKPLHWILYFIFGLLNLASSVLNPVFYTFLNETIHCTLKVKSKMSALFVGCYSQVSCSCNLYKYGTSTCCTALSSPKQKKSSDNDKDEVVDCSDIAIKGYSDDFCEYNRRIFTIFPPSLVSSPINSHIF